MREAFINPDVRTFGLIRMNQIVHGWNDKIIDMSGLEAKKKLHKNTYFINYSSLGDPS